MVLISLWHEKIKEIQDVLTTNLNFMKDIDYSDLLRINMLNTSILHLYFPFSELNGFYTYYFLKLYWSKEEGCCTAVADIMWNTEIL